MKHQPNVVIVDFANQVAAHGNLRKPGLFCPNNGRVLPATAENIEKARRNEVTLDMAWLESRNRFPPQNSEDDHNSLGREPHPITGSRSYFSLFDTFHEDNSQNPADLLRRTRCIKQLEGLYRTEVMEQLNNLMNRNNYFINTMSPVNAVFMQRLAIQYTNEARNKKIITTHEKQVS